MNANDFSDISVTPDARGEQALQYLEDPRREEPRGSLLWVQASGTIKADAYTGAAIRARIEAHLRAGKDRSVSLWLPARDPAKGLVADLVGPLPDRCTLPKDMAVPVRSGDVLVPALVIRSAEEADNAALFLQMTAHRLGVSQPEAYLLAQALIVFAQNGLAHAKDSACDTVVCVAVDRETSEATVVVLDQGQLVCTSGDELATLRAAVGEGEMALRSIAGVRRLADEAGVTATMTLRSGRARLRRPGQSRGDREYVPGWCSALSVQIRGRRRRRAS